MIGVDMTVEGMTRPMRSRRAIRAFFIGLLGMGPDVEFEANAEFIVEVELEGELGSEDELRVGVDFEGISEGSFEFSGKSSEEWT